MVIKFQATVQGIDHVDCLGFHYKKKQIVLLLKKLNI